MTEFIINIYDEEHKKNNYLIWSAIYDRPITEALDLKEFKRLYKKTHGKVDIDKFDNRMKHVEKKGTSEFGATLDTYFIHNHAGDKGEHISKEQILNKYCRMRYAHKKQK